MTIPIRPSFEEVMLLTRTVSSATAFDDIECRALYDLCTLAPIDIVVEIGCQLGRSSSIILQCARAGYLPIHIDPWTRQPDYAAGWHAMATALWTPHVVFQMKTSEALDHMPTDPFIDVLLVDGDHQRDSIWVDTRMADLVKPGGYLCAHDYRRPSLPDIEEVMDRYAVPPKWKHIGTYSTLGVWRRQ